MVGADLSGIELRMLAHYLARYDGGQYADILLNGDIHQVNADKIGISGPWLYSGSFQTSISPAMPVQKNAAVASVAKTSQMPPHFGESVSGVTSCRAAGISVM